jgi:hypothetical protein
MRMYIIRYSSKDDVVHWEQFGKLDANIEIDRIGIEIRNAATVRDRSFGIFNTYNNPSLISIEYNIEATPKTQTKNNRKSE